MAGTGGRPPIDRRWREWAFSEFANEPRVTIASLFVMAEMYARQEKRDDCPSKRTLARFRAEWKGLPEEVRATYQRVSWPQSFESGVLPWDAAPAVLELLASGPRPDVRLARWYHRVTVAAPDMPRDVRRTLAENLSAWEPRAGSDNVTPWAAEGLLVHAYWRGPEWAEAYRRAIEAGRVLAPPLLDLKWLKAIDLLRRATPEEVEAMIASDTEAVDRMEQQRKGMDQ